MTMKVQYRDAVKVPANGIEIVYDAFGDQTAPPVLLVGGLGTQMIAWDANFCQELAARGEAPTVRLRNGDFWQEVADDFNAVLERLASEQAEEADDEADDLACAACSGAPGEARFD